MQRVHKLFPSTGKLSTILNEKVSPKNATKGTFEFNIDNNQTQFNLSTQAKIALGVGIVTSTLSITYLFYSLR